MMTLSEPVGIGLVGAGAFGAFCLAAFAEMPEVRITAVADIDPARADDFARRYDARPYTDLNAMLVNPAVQIVALNTPPHTHGPAGLAILRAGRHLFCEKPLALTTAEGQALIDAAAQHNAHITVNYVMRRNPYWQAAADIARSGTLGALRHMDLANHAAGKSLPDDHWFWDEARSGSIWIEHGVHFFDAFAWVAGCGGEVTASTRWRDARGYIDRVEALAAYGDAAAHFYHGFDQSGQTEQTTVTLTFERGTITLREWVPTSIDVRTPVDAATLRPYLPSEPEVTTLPGELYRIACVAPGGKQAVYRRCIQDGLRDLVRAIQDADHAISVTGADALASLHMAERATALA